MAEVVLSPAEDAEKLVPSSFTQPGTVFINPSARAAQRRLALAIVVIPSLGVIAAAASWFVGHGPSALDIALFSGLFVATTLGVEVGFHRYFSHAAFKAKPILRWTLAVLGSMAAQGPVVFWAATHRRHHAFSDRPGDPHSPYRNGDTHLSLSGLIHAHVGWLFAEEGTDWTRYVPDLARDRRLLLFNQNYLIWVLVGLLAPALVGGVVTGSWWGAFTAFLWGGLVRTFALHHMTWSVNSICHSFGSRPYRVRDRSTNNLWLALPSLGGAWHNTHHAFPSLAKNNVFWWQIDVGGWFVSIVEFLGLAWDVKSPTERMKKKVVPEQTAFGER